MFVCFIRYTQVVPFRKAPLNLFHQIISKYHQSHCLNQRRYSPKRANSNYISYQVVDSGNFKHSTFLAYECAQCLLYGGSFAKKTKNGIEKNENLKHFGNLALKVAYFQQGYTKLFLDQRKEMFYESLNFTQKHTFSSLSTATFCFETNHRSH